MKIPTLLLVLWAAVSSSVAQPITETRWVPIIGFPSTTSVAFVDDNNRTFKHSKEGDKLSSFTVLIVYKSPVIVTVNDTAIEAKSIAARLLVNCNSQFILPLIEFYYNTDFPKVNDKPVGVKIRTATENIREIPKHSVIYQVACPEYI